MNFIQSVIIGLMILAIAINAHTVWLQFKYRRGRKNEE